MMLFHGTSDRNVPYDHSSMLGVGFYGSAYIVEQLEKLDSPYWFYSAEYVDHKMAALPYIYSCDLIMQFINDFVIRGERLQITTDVVDLDGEKQPTRFKVMDYIRIAFSGCREITDIAMHNHDVIMDETLTVEMFTDDRILAHSKEWNINGRKVTISVQKALKDEYKDL